MALGDYYDFGPLMAQLQQGGQGMSGGQNIPQNSWNGGQFVMPPIQQQPPRPQLAPFAETAMGQQAPQAGGLFGIFGNGKPVAGRGRMQAKRPAWLPQTPMFGRLAG